MCGHVSDGFVHAFWSFVAFYSVLIVEDMWSAISHVVGVYL